MIDEREFQHFATSARCGKHLVARAWPVEPRAVGVPLRECSGYRLPPGRWRSGHRRQEDCQRLPIIAVSRNEESDCRLPRHVGKAKALRIKYETGQCATCGLPAFVGG